MLAFIIGNWKMILAGIVFVGAAGVAVFYKLDAQSWQIKYQKSEVTIVTYKNSLNNLNETLVQQNASIQTLETSQKSLQQKLDAASRENVNLTQQTNKLLVNLKTTNVGKTCEQNMDYLRAQAPSLSQPPY